MKPLDSQVRHLVSAASGWMDLGCLTEAHEEIDRIPADQLEHPEVMEIRWDLAVAAESWETAFRIAQRWLALTPDDAQPWLRRAYAARRRPGGGLAQAWDALLPAASKFPKEAIIPFNLACYACLMGHLDRAQDLLRIAMSIGGADRIRELALADQDLEAIWSQVRTWKNQPGNDYKNPAS